MTNNHRRNNPPPTPIPHHHTTNRHQAKTIEAQTTKKPTPGNEVAVCGSHEVGRLPALSHFGIFSMETIEHVVKHSETHVERVLNEKAVPEIVPGVSSVGKRSPRGTKYAGANAVVDLSPIAVHIGANVGSTTGAVDDFGTYLS